MSRYHLRYHDRIDALIGRYIYRYETFSTWKEAVQAVEYLQGKGFGDFYVRELDSKVDPYNAFRLISPLGGEHAIAGLIVGYKALQTLSSGVKSTAVGYAPAHEEAKYDPIRSAEASSSRCGHDEQVKLPPKAKEV